VVGQILGDRYRILRRLGQGGMGEVFLAEHVTLGRKEALKILRAEFADHPDFVSRFRREARATNRVQHPNIVSVYDFGRLPDGRFFLAMEYAEGKRLDVLLREAGPLPLVRALPLLVQLADAVGAAHARGVIHRDLKPENLILVEHHGRSDVLKVLDFGIAKIIAPDHHESRALSRRGDVFGTPAYMSPEQFRGVGDDPRTDCYAIGCIAYELLVGAPPFAGRTMQLMHSHLNEVPDPPSRRRSEARIPAELDAVVLRLMEKDPRHRFQTGAELATALRLVPGFAPRTATPARRKSLPPILDEVTVEATTEDPRWQGDAPLDLAAHRLTLVREVGQALLDLDVTDMMLVIGLAEVQELEDQLKRTDAERAAIGSRLDALDQAAQARSAALRFALGELRFDRGEAGTDASGAQLKEKEKEIERRLAEIAAELEKGLAALSDEELTLVARQARTEERLDERVRALETVIGDLIERERERTGVAPLAARLAYERSHLGRKR
jgi:serine/threonine protein kinase